MAYPTHIAAVLERNERRRKVLDISAVTVLMCALIVGVWWGVASQAWETEGGVVLRICTVLLAIYLLISVFKAAQSKLEQSYAPSFVIDDSDPDVVLLYGAVAMDGKDGAVQKLLRSRPGLELYSGDTYKRYGTTLAATPMSPERQRALRELASKGVSVWH